MAAVLSWYYNSRSGAVNELPLGAGWAAAHSGLGWHGPFDSRAAAIAFYEANKAANPGWKAPTGLVGEIGNVAAAAASPVTDVTGAITNFSNTIVKVWIRAAEAAVGIVLLAIAANAILKQATGVDVAGTAARGAKGAAKTAGKAAAVAAL